MPLDASAVGLGAGYIVMIVVLILFLIGAMIGTFFFIRWYARKNKEAAMKLIDHAVEQKVKKEAELAEKKQVRRL